MAPKDSGACFRVLLSQIINYKKTNVFMKTNVLLLCMCVCMFTQCNRAGNEVYIPEAGQEEVAATDAQGLGEIRADEPPQTPETPGLDNVYRQIDTSFDRIYEKAACLSPAKTGKAEDIAGKWKLALEINGNDTIDRSCEDIVYHFR
jgi:hypothetical protein